MEEVAPKGPSYPTCPPGLLAFGLAGSGACGEIPLWGSGSSPGGSTSQAGVVGGDGELELLSHRVLWSVNASLARALYGQGVKAIS